MKQIALALALLSLTAGCAGTQSHLRLLEADNALRVEAAEAENHDYVVSIRNVRDIGYNPDNPATRRATALRLLSSECPTGRVVGENVIDTGEYLVGRASRTYLVEVACE